VLFVAVSSKLSGTLNTPRRKDDTLSTLDSVKQVYLRLGTEWNGFAAMPDEFIDAGDTVVTLGKYSGTYKATGKHFQADFAHVWRVRDGKAYRFTQYVDTLLVHRALQA